MIALFKALIWLYNSYYRKLQEISKNTKLYLWLTLTSNKKNDHLKKNQNRIIYPSTNFASSFNQISRVGSPILLDFIKII